METEHIVVTKVMMPCFSFGWHDSSSLNQTQVFVNSVLENPALRESLSTTLRYCHHGSSSPSVFVRKQLVLVPRMGVVKCTEGSNFRRDWNREEHDIWGPEFWASSTQDAQRKANGTCVPEWECSHCTQATSNLHARVMCGLGLRNSRS